MDPDPGGPKTYGSYGSGSVTLLSSNKGSSYVLGRIQIRAVTKCSGSGTLVWKNLPKYIPRAAGCEGYIRNNF
jgi:hypothetical protein